MKKIFQNKKIGLVLIILISGLLPIWSFALTYQPLEGDAFSTTITSSSSLGDFLAQIFQIGLALAAALAVVMIVWGGVEVMLSETPFGKSNGKEKIWNAIWGLLLALVSWLILFIINPQILNWSSFNNPPATGASQTSQNSNPNQTTGGIASTNNQVNGVDQAHYIPASEPIEGGGGTFGGGGASGGW